MTIDKETFIALYAKLEAIMPEDGVIDDTCSLINEIIQVFKDYLPQDKAEALIADEPGTSGQDRESYSDDQDRESYYVGD